MKAITGSSPILKLFVLLTPLVCGINIAILIMLLTKYYSVTPDSQGGSINNVKRSFVNIQTVTHPEVEKRKTEKPDDKNYFVIHAETVRTKWRSVKELQRRQIPNMVFYVWCGNKTFEFHHYLSVISAWYVLEPDVIEIRYEYLPQEDKYNTWLSRLRSHIPALSVLPLPPYVRGTRCSSTYGLELILDRGGVFMNETTILGEASTDLTSHNATFSVYDNFQLGFAACRRKNQGLRQIIQELNADKWGGEVRQKIEPVIQSHGDNLFTCNDSVLNREALYRTSLITDNKLSNIVCIILKKLVLPKDVIVHSNDTVRIWIRRILYGDSYKAEKNNFHEEYWNRRGHFLLQQEHSTTTIPFIVHYVWFGQSPMSFSMYLSILSTIHIAQPTAIFIHSDLRLMGPYWNLIQRHPLVHVVYREAPGFIFGRRVLYTQHRSDIVRADLLDKYGGIYMDWDAFWIRSPSDLLNTSKEVVLSRDHMPQLNFPDTINMGVAMAKPRSEFIRAWRSALVNYQSHDFLYNAVELPYKIYEMFPDNVFINDRLQVMCYYLKCHPTFHPDFKHWGRAQPFDWKTDVYSIHFTHPDPPAFDNESSLQSSEGMFADIGRHIWRLSGNGK